MSQQTALNRQRLRRKFRVRKRLHGDSVRPRLTVHRSHKNISAQIVNDDTRTTLVSASTLDKDLVGGIAYGGNKTAAEAIGKALAEKAKAAGVTKVRFDRGPFKFHGRVAALAAAAREAGLDF
ncbi:50S ribosomal protein L18 [Pirellulimonas nuda]|uniref:Large ribosomal subunit protein uL18 n=1 Tax=Pirellulimonas nuda TaxID=2528009 RepID=A0A518DII7_9BACT|nr:50S ribosomal protein L18 [Pirellulimonas nuda]QDU91293.1 50S ribosomal protein L18 [Pirellulimonas nuda]